MPGLSGKIKASARAEMRFVFNSACFLDFRLVDLLLFYGGWRYGKYILMNIHFISRVGISIVLFWFFVFFIVYLIKLNMLSPFWF